MFDIGKQSYKTDVILGERYRDDQTGVVGVATAVHFFQYACERITLEYLKPDRELAELTFDAPRLTHIATEEKVETARTGGPARAGEIRSVPSRR